MQLIDATRADQLYREEYGQDRFVFGDPIVGKESTIVGRDGGVDVYIRLLAGPDRRIDQIFLTGAFVVSPPRVIPDLEAALRGIALQDAPSVAAEFLQDRLLEIRGVDAKDETDTQLPLEFLTQQLERRETADEAVSAHDDAALAALYDGVLADAKRLRVDVERALDGDDVVAARALVRELRFLSKLAEDLDAMRTLELDR